METLDALGSDRLEQFVLKVNGSTIHSTFTRSGAQSLPVASIWAQKDNRGSQVPGTGASPFVASNVVYTSNFGTGNWSPQAFLRTNTDGQIGYQAGRVWTHD